MDLGGERRQVTAMFCDIVGSTRLMHTLGAEDFQDVLRDFHQYCKAAVEHYAGYVVGFRNDAVFALFGYPKSREASAERAIRAAFEIVGWKTRQNTLDTPTVRIGIATGPVIIARGLGPELDVVGEAANLAARLQVSCEPGQITVCDVSQQMTARSFRFQGPRALDLKGFDAPMRAWMIERAIERAIDRINPDMVQFDGARYADNGFFGRHRELEHLHALWDAAKDGNGRAVAIQGDAGIGKSRLLWEFVRPAPPAIRVAQFYGSPFDTTNTLQPITTAVQRWIGDKSSLDLFNLDAFVSTLKSAQTPPASWLQTLVHDWPDRAPVAESAFAKRERMLSAILSAAEAASRDSPLLIVVEDAHWLDPTSQEVLARLCARARRLSILVLITARPDFNFEGHGLPDLETIHLQPLNAADARSLILCLSGAEKLQADTITRIIDRAEGVPFFIEELAREIIDRGAHQSKQSHESMYPSLQDLLTARLDSTAHAKETAQIASVIGREFERSLIAQLVPEAPLAIALDELLAGNLIYDSGTEPFQRFAFRHALLQEVAYSTLLKKDCRRLHLKIAKLHESRMPESEFGRSELLAYHYHNAGEPAKAIEHFGIAARKALQRSSNLEVIALADRAFALLNSMPESPERRRAELDFLVLRGAALIWRGEFSKARQDDEATLALYDRIYASAENRQAAVTKQLDPTDAARGRLSWTLWILGYPGRALDNAQRAISHARDSQNPMGLAFALLWSAAVHHCCGNWAAANAQAEELAKLTRQQNISFFDAAAVVVKGAVAVSTGQLKRGIGLIEEGVAHFPRQHARFGTAWAQSIIAEGYLNLGLHELALATIEKGFEAIAIHGERHWEAELERTRGCIYAGMNAHADDAEAAFRRALQISREQGARSLELRAALSFARFFATTRNDVSAAREIFIPVFARFEDRTPTADIAEAIAFAQQIGYDIGAIQQT
jgi:class 3 adenylate cyclase/tetratricopeptide (TPR) repeat protein